MKDDQVRAYVNKQLVSSHLVRVAVYAPRYKRLPRWLMRYKHFRVDTGETRVSHLELEKPAPAGEVVVVMYEITL